MKKAAFILFTTLVITVCAKAQTVITQKGTKLTIDSSKWTLTGNDIFNKNSGFVGIGTNAPGFKTHISLATAGGTGISTGNTTNTGLQIEQTTPNTSILQHLKAYNSNTSLIKEIYLGINPTFNSDTGVFSISRVGFSDFILNMMNGNVGIGNNSPKNKLSVSGSFGANITSTGSNLTLDATNYTAIMTSGTPTFTLPAANASTGRIYNIINRTSAARTLANNGTDAVNDFNAAAITSVAAHSSVTLQSDGTAWQQIASGYSGMDLTNDAFSNNTANTRVELATNADGTTARTAGTEFVIKDDGKLGIGTASPAGRVDIVSDNVGLGAGNDFYFNGYGTSKQPAIFLGSANGTAAAPTNLANGDPIGALYFNPRANGSFQYTTSGIESTYKGDGTTNLTDLAFRTSSDIKMIIDETGKVGIGLTNPSTKVDISGGDMRLSNEGTNAYNGLTMKTYNSTASGYSQLLIFRARGTKASPSYSQSGDILGAIRIGEGNGEAGGAGILATASQTHTVSASGTDLSFFTTANGSTATSNRMTITQAGYVGIGNSFTPDAPLQINGTTMTTPSLIRTYFNQQAGTALNNGTSTSSSIQVHANGWYWADGGGFVATSDARIKNITGFSNTGEDLEKIKQIQVTDYTYIDKINNSSTPQKKVIAQQLQSVYPIAVNTNSGIIPNVFETAAGAKVVGNTTEITTAKAHTFKTGDMVKLIIEDVGEKVLKVTVTGEHTFTVAEPVSPKIFVYGKKVNDLLSVDYDAVSMLNVSATQELAKQLKQTQEKAAQLEKDNLELKKMMLEMKAQLDAINKRLGSRK